MVAAAIEYPALAFSQGTMLVMRCPEELTTATRTGLKNAFFDRLSVVDSSNREFEIEGARPLQRFGWFRHRVQVELNVVGERDGPSLGELKARVLAALAGDRWTAVYGIEEIAAEVGNAPGVRELIAAVSVE